ncbi:MAG: MFS transporter [Thermoplasmataceae archaeon]
MTWEVIQLTESHTSENSLRNFTLLMAETGISTFATSIFTILILWIAISETKSSLITGVTSAFLVAPLVLNIVVGAIIDKSSRKKVYAIIGPLLKALAATLLLLTIYNYSLIYDTVLLLLSALTFGISIDILVPIRAIWSQKFLRKPVYLKGMSVANIVSRGSRLSGFLVAALAITINLRITVSTVILLYIISTVPILFISSVNDSLLGKGRLRDVMKDGLSYIGRTNLVAEIVIISSISALFWGMADTVSTVMINRVFNLTSAYLSFTFFAISLGGIAGSSLTSKLETVKRVGRKLPWLYGSAGLSLMLIAIYPSILVLLIVFFFVGIVTGIASPIISAVLFGNVPRDKIGRIQGAMDTFGTSFNSVSGILAGLSMTLIFPGNVFYIMGAGLIALSIIISQFKSLSKTDI